MADRQLAFVASQIVFNVSGHRFITTRETLLKYPDTKLGKLAHQSHGSLPKQEYFFDADDEVFREVLRYYRTGYLHLPTSMCYQSFIKQLEFWEIKSNEISDCCFTTDKTEDEMEEEFRMFEQRIEPDTGVDDMSFKYHMWYFLTDPMGPYTRYRKASIVWTFFYVVMITIGALCRALLTLPAINLALESNRTISEYYSTLKTNPCWFKDQAMKSGVSEEVSALVVLEVVVSLAIIIETIIRFSCCPQKRYFCRSVQMLDVFLAISDLTYLVMYTTLRSPIDISWAGCSVLLAGQLITSVFSSLRFLKVLTVAMKMRAMKVLVLSLRSSRQEILLLLILVINCCLVFGPFLYYLETLTSGLLSESLEPSITSIPEAYWLLLVTMTTVGYGDYSPISFPGRIFTAVFMLLGLIVTALPVAIIGSNFTIYYEYSLRRERNNESNSS